MDIRCTWHNFNFEFSVAEPSSNARAQSRVGPGLVTPLTTRLHLTAAASTYFNIGIRAATRRATKSLWDYTTSCSQTKQQANPVYKTLLPCPHTAASHIPYSTKTRDGGSYFTLVGLLRMQRQTLKQNLIFCKAC